MIKQLVKLSGRESRSFSKAADVIAQLHTLPFGCLFVDIEMPGLNGIDLLAELRRRDMSWPVVMVSGTTDVGQAVAAFRTGAVHFLRKPFRRDDFRRALEEVASVAEKRREEHLQLQRALAIRLTLREREILDAMARGEQTKAIAWQLGLSVRTVEMHRGNILSKLSARNSAQALAFARELELIR